MNNPINITFSGLVNKKIPGMHLGILSAENLIVTAHSARVDTGLAELEHFIKQKFTRERPASDPVVSAVRRMYRRIGWEPTQYRPSSEAMIRRILKGTGLYRINNLVDLANIVSTRYHLPMGLYDTAKINADIIVDVGGAGESYRGIFKELIHAEGKLVVRDRSGIFGNPTADSARTCIAPTTTRVLTIFFTPPEVEPNYLLQALTTLSETYQQECPGGRIQTGIVSAGTLKPK
jgi:DNA/RNA-binding domain of Phe-tRNA-synthetase-like protein